MIEEEYYKKDWTLVSNTQLAQKNTILITTKEQRNDCEDW